MALWPIGHLGCQGCWILFVRFFNLGPFFLNHRDYPEGDHPGSGAWIGEGAPLGGGEGIDVTGGALLNDTKRVSLWKRLQGAEPAKAYSRGVGSRHSDPHIIETRERLPAGLGNPST